MIAGVLLALGAPPARAQQELVEGQPYVKLETRQATLTRMRKLLRPEEVAWGEWYLLTPFPYAGHDLSDLATVLAPEAELAQMHANGPGPDLGAVYSGKKEIEARWKRLGEMSNRRVELNIHEDPELNDLAVCYLYTTIESDKEQTIERDCGSDDGMRLWLNGTLLVDHDVPRGLDPTDEHLVLELERGTNHVLFKIAEGGGDWAFQIRTNDPLGLRTEAHLEYLLERDFPRTPERAHYSVFTIPVPEEVVLEVGGLDFLSDGTPIVATRRGEVYRVFDAYAKPPLDARLELFASGLHEPLGLAVRREAQREAVFVAQRPELTRLVDEDGDGRADLYECFSAGWGISGNYHEFAFGPKFDREGNAWVTLNVGFCGSLGKSVAPWRGWALKITPEREVVPVACGLRSPNGIGHLSDGSTFYLDNQGDYVATNRLSELRPGSWHGHPASLRWRGDAVDPGTRPAREPPSIWFPYRKMGQSTADLALDETGGRFGPFAGQFFVGDQTLASVMRVFLERVNGHAQGACFPFLEGLQSGVNRVAFAPDGSLFVGETDRGWGSIGGRPYGLQRIVYTGVEPFEIRAMRVHQSGFELEFTLDLDPKSASDPASYELGSYTYEYHADYGAPEEDTEPHRIERAELLDPRRVRLDLSHLRANYVHELSAGGVRSMTGDALLHDKAYYTLVEIPGVQKHEERALPRVLFVTHSAGYVHDVVERPDPFVLSAAEERLTEAARGRFEIHATQDCAEITASKLSSFDAVVFYTTGELPVPEGGREALIDWVAKGGAFAGVHCATDTFYEFRPYQEMLGGVFDGHPWEQEVALKVLEPNHPATDHLGDSFRIADEIYQFRDFDRRPLRVLLALDTESVDASLGKRADGLYALSWARDFGEGRVFYTALGHRPENWRDPRFLAHLLDGIAWAIDGPDLPARAPVDAKVLFDGVSLEAWKHRNGSEKGAWRLVGDGSMEVVAGTSDLVSRFEFGDALIHVEFMTPAMPDATGQERGNSGVYVQGRYEVQVLDSYGLESGLGDCGAIYGHKVPDVNGCRPPERWQSYDIEFRAPRFDAAGERSASARMTVWHNGRRIHDDVEVPKPTPGGLTDAEDEVARGPLLLQDHGDLVRFRNTWVLER